MISVKFKAATSSLTQKRWDVVCVLMQQKLFEEMLISVMQLKLGHLIVGGDQFHEVMDELKLDPLQFNEGTSCILWNPRHPLFEYLVLFQTK